jgi:hypothetical protein
MTSPKVWLYVGVTVLLLWNAIAYALWWSVP